MWTPNVFLFFQDELKYRKSIICGYLQYDVLLSFGLVSTPTISSDFARVKSVTDLLDTDVAASVSQALTMALMIPSLSFISKASIVLRSSGPPVLISMPYLTTAVLLVRVP